MPDAGAANTQFDGLNLPSDAADAHFSASSTRPAFAGHPLALPGDIPDDPARARAWEAAP